MTERFIIGGKNKLAGTVEISGSKNDAGPILAAALLTKEPCVIDNLPLVEDVLKLLKILKEMGVKIEWLSQRKLKIKSGEKVDPEKIEQSLIGETRVSVLLIGALIARFKKFKIAHPGGDRIGLRPITTHLEALKKLGVKVENDGYFYRFNGENLTNSEVVLGEFSVTATENLMMAAATVSGTTIIKGAAAEPHVQDLGKMLGKMGAKVEGLGTHTIKIEGKKRLKGVSHKIIPDYVEAGTFLVAGALTPGIVEIKNAPVEHLDLFLAKLEEIGVLFKKGKDSIKVSFSPELKAVRVQALPYPGFPTDLIPIVIPLLTQAKGKSLIHDPLYENRLNFTQGLRKMGADIEIVDPHRAFVFGKTPLKGVEIDSWDIRAGASLIIAALSAAGKTILGNAYQVDRGYEKIEEKLQRLGANIQRVKND